MREAIKSYVREGTKERRDRIIICTMLVVIAVAIFTGVFFMLRTPAAAETVPCDHTDGCTGYVAAIPEVPCAHAHDDVCGYSEGTPEQVCVNPECDLTEEGCTYAAEVPGTACTHEHDGECGYAAEVPAVPCSHDEQGYCPQKIDYRVRTTVTAVQPTYKSGEVVQFTVTAQFATPNDAPEFVEMKIDLPAGIEYVGGGLPSTNPDYPETAGWIQIKATGLGADGTAKDFYLYYNEALRVFNYSLMPGETILMAVINLKMPNGTTDAATIELEPVFVDGASDLGNDEAVGGKTTIVSEFSWEAVSKTANVPNLGNFNSAASNIVYTISANNQKAGQTTGVAFTGKYVLKDTMTLNGFYYNTGTATETVKTATSTKFQIDGIDVLEINEGEVNDGTVKSDVVITPVISGTKITGFEITYTLENVKKEADLASLAATVTLFSKAGAPRLTDTSASTFEIKNHADFDAYSMFYEGAADDDNANRHHESAANKDLTATGTYAMSKAAYADAALSKQISASANKVEPGDGVYYKITFTNSNKSLAELYLTDALTTTMGGKAIFDPESIEIVSIVATSADGMTGADSTAWSGSLAPESSGAAGSETIKTINYKKFEKVPVGAVITMTIKATSLDGASNQQTVPNTVYATEAVKTSTSAGTDLVTKQTANAYFSSKYTGINVNKTVLDAKGNPIEKPADRLFQVGDTITYQITITNTSSGPVETMYFRDWWSGGVLELVSISGVPNGTVEFTPNTYTGFTADGTEYPIDISPNTISQFKVNGLVLPVGATTIETKYKVLKEGAGKNQVELKLPDGSNGSGVLEITVDVKGIAVNANKEAAVATLDNGVVTDGGKSSLAIGDVLHYKLAVKNLSFAEDMILKYFEITDTFDSALDAPIEVTYGGKTGTVFLEVEDGALRPLLASEFDITGGKLTATISAESLPKGKTLTLHVFFEISKDNYDAVTESKEYGFYNEFGVIAKKLSTDEAQVEAKSNKKFVPIDPPEANQSATVTKSVIGVISKGTLDGNELNISEYKNSGTLSAMAGDYVLYKVTITNTSNAKVAPFKVHSFVDTLPDGMEFVGMVKGNAYSSTKISGIYTTSATKVPYDNSDAAGFINVNGQVVHATFYYDPVSLNPGSSASVYLLAKVNTTMSGYHNVAGFEIHGDISAIHHPGLSIHAQAGHKVVHGEAPVSGPIFQAGITKTTAQFSLDAGATWIDFSQASNYAITPDTLVKWKIEYQNGADSSRAYDSYSITDVLPDEFEFVSADFAGHRAPVSTTPAESTSIDGKTQLTWEFSTESTTPLKPGNTDSFTIITKWKDGEDMELGTYYNQAVLKVPYKITQVLTGERVDDYSVSTLAQVVMFGMYGTTSYKTIENVNPVSPFYGESGIGLGTAPAINAIAGDTIRYTLNVENCAQISMPLMKFAIIDTLPTVGDMGVVNRSEGRSSAFEVTFAANPNVTVSVKRAAGGTDNITALCKINYKNDTGTFTVDDWSGNAPWGGTPANSNSIRIVVDDSAKIAKGDRITVTYDALVAPQTGTTTLPNPTDIAWNSFGYTYLMVSGQTPFYAEPIKVGVKIPASTIVTKTVVDVAGNEVLDTTDFTFTLWRNPTGAQDGWQPASGVRYEKNGTVYTIGVDGKFTLKHGDSIKMMAPAIGFFKITEDAQPADSLYSLKSINGTAATEFIGDGSTSANFVNEIAQKEWKITLIKTSHKGEDIVMEGVEFKLEKLVTGDDGDVWEPVTGYASKLTDSDGKIYFTGLGAGQYRITEIATWDKYILVDPIIVNIPYVPASELPEGVTVTPDNDGYGSFTVHVVNDSTYEIVPSGGIGTAGYTAAGLLIMAAAAGAAGVILKKKREKRSEQ